MDLRRLDRIPPVTAVMTPFPWHVELDSPLAEALDMMRRNDIHHLPVMEGGEIVGVVHGRAAGALGRARADSGPDPLRVRDACSRDVYVVDLAAPLDRVLIEMARRHVDAAVVVKKGRLAGILTATDACRCFGEWLGATFARGGGDAA